MNATETVKVRRIAGGTGRPDLWIIHDRTRDRVEERNDGLMDERVKIAMATVSIGFFEAVWSEAGWKLGEPVGGQNW